MCASGIPWSNAPSGIIFCHVGVISIEYLHTSIIWACSILLMPLASWSIVDSDALGVHTGIYERLNEGSVMESIWVLDN